MYVVNNVCRWFYLQEKKAPTFITGYAKSASRLPSPLRGGTGRILDHSCHVRNSLFLFLMFNIGSLSARKKPIQPIPNQKHQVRRSQQQHVIESWLEFGVPQSLGVLAIYNIHLVRLLVLSLILSGKRNRSKT